MIMPVSQMMSSIHNSLPPTSQQATEAVPVLQLYLDSKGSEEGIGALVGIGKIVQQLAAQSQVQITLSSYFQHH